jgi:hypothetical protein
MSTRAVKPVNLTRRVDAHILAGADEHEITVADGLELRFHYGLGARKFGFQDRTT